jgi:hypothetical protein
VFAALIKGAYAIHPYESTRFLLRAVRVSGSPSIVQYLPAPHTKYPHHRAAGILPEPLSAQKYPSVSRLLFVWEKLAYPLPNTVPGEDEDWKIVMNKQWEKRQTGDCRLAKTFEEMTRSVC